VDSWNKGAETMFGYTEQEIIGQDADVLFTPEDRAKKEPERELRLAREEGRAENERWHARRDGSLFYGSGSMMALRDRTGELRGYVKIMRDLTESKRTQESLKHHLDELTRFNSAAVGRETRMIDLKKEVNELCVKLGNKPRYSLIMEEPEERKKAP
jgi:PAS domain S-box-containing protein